MGAITRDPAITALLEQILAGLHKWADGESNERELEADLVTLFSMNAAHDPTHDPTHDSSHGFSHGANLDAPGDASYNASSNVLHGVPRSVRHGGLKLVREDLPLMLQCLANEWPSTVRRYCPAFGTLVMAARGISNSELFDVGSGVFRQYDNRPVGAMDGQGLSAFLINLLTHPVADWNIWCGFFNRVWDRPDTGALAAAVAAHAPAREDHQVRRWLLSYVSSNLDNLEIRREVRLLLAPSMDRTEVEGAVTGELLQRGLLDSIPWGDRWLEHAFAAIADTETRFIHALLMNKDSGVRQAAILAIHDRPALNRGSGADGVPLVPGRSAQTGANTSATGRRSA